MFWIRLRSGIILVVLAVIFIVAGGTWLWGCLTVISMIGLYELYRVVKIHKTPLGAVGYISAFCYSLGLLFSSESDRMPVSFFCLFLILFLAVYVFSFPRYRTEQAVLAFFGLFYVNVMLMYIYLTRMLDRGYLVWLIFLSSWGCDTCAYCAGRLFGRHKLAPVLSPKKTVEGAIGGAVGAAVLGFLYAQVIGHQMMAVDDPDLACAAACGIAAVISQVGDLAASAIKRNHQIKDYGHLIPGHGGVLDRFDSMIFTAPAIYFAITFLR